MDYKLLFDIAVLAGELMAKYGAETYRVEETMARILTLSELKTAEVFVTTTGFCVTLDHPTMDSMTVVRRISQRDLNLRKIHEVNLISRQLCKKELTLEEALAQLKAIKKEKPRHKGNYIPMVAITAAFTLMFGGHYKEVIIAGVAGLCSAYLLKICKRKSVHLFLCDVICAMSIAMIAFSGKIIFGASFDTDTVIIASIMPFVPGVAITNAVFDTLHGDYLSGLARAMEAVVIAIAVAIGVGCGLGLCNVLAGVF